MQIVKNAEIQINKCNQNPNRELENVKTKVVKLQKQLLSASILEKPNLEADLQSKLRAAEKTYFELKSDSRLLEITYLQKYIREKYD